MIDLFDYYNKSNKIGFSAVLSTFVSHHDFWYKDKERTVLKSVKEINSFDRQIILEDFWKERTNNDTYSIHKGYIPIKEVSESYIKDTILQYIDLVIPRHYFVLKEEVKRGHIDRSEYRKRYKNISNVKGLIFTVEDNYKIEESRDSLRNSYKIKNKKTKADYRYSKLRIDQLKQMLNKDLYTYEYQLKKNIDELSRHELVSLLEYFYSNTMMEHLDEYIEKIYNLDEDKIYLREEQLDECEEYESYEEKFGYNIDIDYVYDYIFDYDILIKDNYNYRRDFRYGDIVTINNRDFGFISALGDNKVRVNWGYLYCEWVDCIDLLIIPYEYGVDALELTARRSGCEGNVDDWIKVINGYDYRTTVYFIDDRFPKVNMITYKDNGLFDEKIDREITLYKEINNYAIYKAKIFNGRTLNKHDIVFYILDKSTNDIYFGGFNDEIRIILEILYNL